MTTNNNTARDLLERALSLMSNAREDAETGKESGAISFIVEAMHHVTQARAYLASSATDAQAVDGCHWCLGTGQTVGRYSDDSSEIACPHCKGSGGEHAPQSATDSVRAEGGAVALPPIERDELYDRSYIPLPGGWEIQTKGKGSSFRLCDTKSGDRVNIPGTRVEFEMLERMAREVHAAAAPAPQQAALEVTVETLANAFSALNAAAGWIEGYAPKSGQHIVARLQKAIEALTPAPFDTSSPCGDPGVKVLSRDAVTGEPRMTMRREG